MGIYINPTNGQSKEQYLAAHGREISREEFVTFSDFEGTHLPVCHVDNGPFTAALVCPDSREVACISGPDPRPRLFYLMPKDKLRPEDGVR